MFFNIETRACDVQSWETKDCKAEAPTAAQSWETNVKDCKAETDTAVQSGGHILRKNGAALTVNLLGNYSSSANMMLVMLLNQR